MGLVRFVANGNWGCIDHQQCRSSPRGCRLTCAWSGPARDQLVTVGRWRAPAAQPQDVMRRLHAPPTGDIQTGAPPPTESGRRCETSDQCRAAGRGLRHQRVRTKATYDRRGVPHPSRFVGASKRGRASTGDLRATILLKPSGQPAHRPAAKISDRDCLPTRSTTSRLNRHTHNPRLKRTAHSLLIANGRRSWISASEVQRGSL